MTTLCYNLATHKNVQEKLIEEIDTIETIDHDTIADLHYLEAAINENLRMYPPAHVQERVCKKDTELKGRVHWMYLHSSEIRGLCLMK